MEHTEHCKKRMKWGDGECECQRRVSASFSNELLCELRDLWFIDFRSYDGSEPPDRECDAELLAMINLIRNFNDT